MSSERNSPPLNAAQNNGRRRSSFVDLFGRAPNSTANASGTSAYPGPITNAAAQAQRRRLSLSTVGLGASPSQPSPFGLRRESVSSAGSGSVDESPFEDGDAASGAATSPFARRLSFGARALRDSRQQQGAGGSSNTNGASGDGGGFNFAENMRTRAERNSSISSVNSPTQMQQHGRAKSVSVMEPPREMPMTKPVNASKPPDAYQERMLKGDFYMD
ncbi:hypothetical protein K402DRAFT_392596 [Aulographum hederae CBS 113979]|uniref:Uncharacterized protein n=1 Tax=Aulographum hederae CBS 113979 TaxID=1176131 RepID=A0A6G1H3J7_9PEZI|nr:hypothetical protein K402DRAFT_392596 [Aulographum hederae CBS 113979]